MEHQFDSTKAKQLFTEFSYVISRILSVIQDDSTYANNLKDAIKSFEYEMVFDILSDTADWYCNGKQYLWVKSAIEHDEIDTVLKFARDHNIQICIRTDSGYSKEIDVIRRACILTQYNELRDTAAKILQRNKAVISESSAKIQFYRDGIRQIFLSKQKKKFVVEAYEMISELQSSDDWASLLQIISDIDKINETKAQNAYDLFKRDPDTVYTVIFNNDSNKLIAREAEERCCLSEDARRLSDWYEAATKLGGTIQLYESGYLEDANECSASMQLQSMMEILQKIPASDLYLYASDEAERHELQTICLYLPRNISALTIYNSDIKVLFRHTSIDRDTLTALKNASRKLADQILEDTSVRLSTDNKSEYADRTVSSIHKLRRIRDIKAKYSSVTSENDSAIMELLTDLRKASSGLTWILSSDIERSRFNAAFRRLMSLRQGLYGEAINSIMKDLQETRSVSISNSWDDFTANSISYYNTLEDINPALLGNRDGDYKLPPDFAKEIQQTEINLSGLQCELRRYQEIGVKYILHQKRVLLGDEMGLGKTIQAIACMVSMSNNGATHFLVVCPTSVLVNWCIEVERMSSLRVIKVHGKNKEDDFRQWMLHGGVAITTYEATSCFELPTSFSFDLFVCDEAHYIKNPKARRTQRVVSICEHADRLLFMTGTALENKVEEMVCLIRLLREDIATQIQMLERISESTFFRRQIIPVYYRRKREDVLAELPELIETREWCSMSPEEEMEYYYSLLMKNYALIRRVSWNVPDIKKSSKAKRMAEIIEEAASDGRKVIVFSFFLDTIAAVQKCLGSKCMEPITGSVSPTARQDIINRFNQAPAGTVLVSQIQSGGTGLNIQSASVIILCEPQFKPSIENQAISRAYRMGQTRNVMVYRLLCSDSVDSRITSILEHKQMLFDAFADKSDAAQIVEDVNDETFKQIIEEETTRLRPKMRKQMLKKYTHA